MIKYGFFNSKRLITGDYDRKYNADDVNAYFKGAISRDGIYQFVGNQCRVITGGGMNVIVQNGKGQINYHWFEVASNEAVSIRDAHATLNRWTAVVARYDEVNRNIYLTTIDGTESERPNKPQIQRTDALRDICLAYVYVAAGATEIVRDNIIDTVDDIEVCGFVSTLLTGTGGVKKVHQLPIPSSTCQGDIYYLIEESKTAGKKYIKGYYYCEPSKTEYDYVDVDWIADSLSNRPVASEAYLNIVFFGNDNNLWYRCVETSENVYEWQEITVNQVEELPEPTEDLNNQYYVIGSSLYKVAKQESNYKWYTFGKAKSSGSIEPVDILPVPGEDWEGLYVEYNGAIYKCVKKGTIWVWEKIGDVPIVADFKYSVIVDESNLDPEGAVTYADDCENYFPATKISYGSWESFIKEYFKPCVIRPTDPIGQPNYYLLHDNRAYKEDGTPAIKTGIDGDCMIEVKSLWYNFEVLDENRYKFSVSDKKLGVTWECFNWNLVHGEYVERPYIYLSSYVSTYGSPMKSVTGSPTEQTRQMASDYRLYAAAKGSGYGNIDYRRVMLLQGMALLLGKNRNFHAQLSDVPSENTYIIPGQNDAGKFISNNVFLGIESLFSMPAFAGAFVDGSIAIQKETTTSGITYKNITIKWTDDKSKYGETEESTLDYENHFSFTVTKNANSPWFRPIKVMATNKGGFFGIHEGGNSSTGYTNVIRYASNNTNMPISHVYWSSDGGTWNGPFGFNIWLGISNYCSGRLCRFY